MSWEQVGRDIDTYLDIDRKFDVLSDREKESKFYKSLGNKLNQFVNGMGPSRGHKLRDLSGETLAAVVRFLSDPHIALIVIDESQADTSDLSMAALMANSLISAADRRTAGEWEKSGSAVYMGARYADESSIDTLPRNAFVKPNQIVSCVYLELSQTPNPFIKETILRVLTHMPDMRSKNTNNLENIIIQVWQGLSIALPIGDIILILRDENSSRSRIITAQAKSDKTSPPSRMIIYTLHDRNYSSLINMSQIRGYDLRGKDTRASLSIFKTSLVKYGFLSGISHLELIPAQLNLPDIKDHVLRYLSNKEGDFDVIRLPEPPTISKFEITSPRKTLDYTEELLTYIKDGKILRSEELIKLGARLDRADPDSGLNALHMLAGMGWRPGIRAALKHPDRCDFTATDRNGNLASYRAFVLADDIPVYRLLRYLEDKAGVYRKLATRPPGPTPF